ncbi:hypothetical protein [Geodermatophilus sp. URMC 62]|uniref:hypothetical protein n=1 Tax=Geodermatophilus sp. URMC 62 TaxID=3423414 RepID=UPI00406D270F
MGLGMGGDVVTDTAGNFERVLQVDAQGGVWLQGPLELAADQTLSTLYVWLSQTREDGTGGVATAVLDGGGFNSAAARQAGGTPWRTQANAVHGELRAGPATGMALAVLTRDDGSTISYWWSDNGIHLKQPAPVAVQPHDKNALAAELLQAAANILKHS